MNRGRPYMNRFVKRKEQEIMDSYHTCNLEEIKGLPTRIDDHYACVPINNSKAEFYREVRDLEIDRENKALLQRMTHIMSKKGNYSVQRTKSINTKANKSLNDIYRKRQLQSIEHENQKFVQRLQNRKATLNVAKLNRDWEDNKSVIKKMANHKFNLTNLSRLKPGTSDKLSYSRFDNMKLSKIKVIGGQKMLVTVEFTDNLLKITGDCQDSSDLKVIEIPKDEGLMFIDRECNGRIERVMDKLRYDFKEDSLILMSEVLEEEQEMNPEARRQSKKTRVRVNRPSRLEERKELPKLESSKKMRQRPQENTKTTPTPEPIQTVEASLKHSTKKSEQKVKQKSEPSLPQASAVQAQQEPKLQQELKLEEAQPEPAEQNLPQQPKGQETQVKAEQIEQMEQSDHVPPEVKGDVTEALAGLASPSDEVPKEEEVPAGKDESKLEGEPSNKVIVCAQEEGDYLEEDFENSGNVAEGKKQEVK